MNASSAVILPQTVQATPAIILYTSSFREQGFGAFKMNDYEIIAAHNADEALKWFVENWNVEPSDLYAEPVEILLDDTINYVDSPESDIRELSYRELIKTAIFDKLEFPCIVATYDW